MEVEEITTENDIRHGDDEVVVLQRSLRSCENILDNAVRHVAWAEHHLADAQVRLAEAQKRAAEAASSGATL